MDKAPIPGVGEEASASGAASDSALQGAASPLEDEPSATELKRFGTFLVIQGLFLVGSPFAGGFHYSIWSMLDTALFVLSIGICAMGFVLETKDGRRLAFRLSALVYALGVLDMSVNILLSGILGWRGIAPPL